MKRRRIVSTRVGKPTIKTVRVETSSLVTLEHPEEGTEAARGAFARLAPPEGLTEDEVASWRQSVALVAKAVKVLPQPKAADVPMDASRPVEDEEVGTIREEAMALAEATKSKRIIKQVSDILDEVGA